MTQKEIILGELESGRTITTFDSYEKFGITRLPARICELRKEGYGTYKGSRTRWNETMPRQCRKDA